MEIKDTLNLPQTEFPMKASLTKAEPKMIEWWEKENIYDAIRDSSKSKEKFVFHDGPPYANGHIHMGHALNKILKDFIVKIMSMKGFDAGFIPGWDCHGLPIEHQVSKKLKEKKMGLEKAEIRKQCRTYAQEFVAIQREEFKRLGVFADWGKPYLTMDYSYEATIVREFGKFVEKGMVYKGLKPVHWCTSCRTALAEAEVEHADHTSPSIYVKFAVKSGAPESMGDLGKAFMVIWTTTPWTLPANLAISLHPDFQYVSVAIGDEVFIVAEERLSQLILEWDVTEYKILGSCKGKDWENAVCQHPFIDRESKVILGEHVTLEQGTGCVHTAPGHGQDDYIVGLKYGLEPYNPVDDGGIFKSDVEHFAGMFVRKANPEIIEKLKQDGFLIHNEDIKHSYPHCWRCRQPVIFRATSQWFISMEKEDLRRKALAGIERTQWIPSWGKDRIYSMIENRPDWCVSRQRAWGVPITVFLDKRTGEPLRDQSVIDRISSIFEEEGSDAWYISDPQRFLGKDYDAKDFEQIKDIIEVWFDSGSSHTFVLEARPELKWPASLYLEGSDQHRGWFHTSLLQSSGTRGRAPFEAVLTHGFVLDEAGRKMSKSMGNVTAPQDVIDRSGADILRLWVVGSDYSEDLRIGPEILKRQVDLYRRLRNTLRYVLGNLNDFKESERVDLDEMPELERWVLHRLSELDITIREGIDNFDFHALFQQLHNFCAVDLSAFYFDIRKDVLYCDALDSLRRRATRTVLDILFNTLTTWLAPILCFTAEEAWQARVKNSEDSVHLKTFIEIPKDWNNKKLAEKWDLIRDVRKVVTGALEIERAEKRIGSSLQAKPTVYLTSDAVAAMEGLDAADIFITSGVILVESEPPANAFMLEEVAGVGVVQGSADGTKCERCWKILPEVEVNNEPVCDRCTDALKHTGS